jgi:ketosteroid isomerase-like protein
MSQENVELARRGVEAFAAGDWETWFEGFDPEIEWEETPGLGPDASVYRGIEEVRGAVGSWTAMWTEYAFEACEYLDAGDDVVVLVQERGRGRRTGASVERKSGQILTFRDGKLIRNRLYGSWAEAREAAGLSE